MLREVGLQSLGALFEMARSTLYMGGGFAMTFDCAPTPPMARRICTTLPANDAEVPATQIKLICNAGRIPTPYPLV